MKVRTGFVSNSSSSSFVVLGIGFKHEEDAETVAKTLGWKEDGDVSDFFYSMHDGLEYLYVEEEDGTFGIIGKVYADVSSDGSPLETQRITLSQLTITAYEVANKLGVDVSRVQLYMGTRPS